MTRSLDFAATGDHRLMVSWSHHLVPIWHALPDEWRGTFYASPGEVSDYLEARGIYPTNLPIPVEPDRPIVTAGMGDVFKARGRPIALVNHGAGQTYTLANASYSGGPRREPVGLYLCPSERDARTNLAAYPTAQAEAVGCPRLDPWLSGDRSSPDNDHPVVALAFHWPADLRDAVPELSMARHAWTAYLPSLGQLAAHLQGLGCEVLGHAHPLMLATCRPHYQRWGVEVVDDLEDVYDRADVMVVDRSSVGWEFWSLGRGVLWLNGPGWRMPPDGPEQWPRWSDLVPREVRCDRPPELLAAIDRTLADGPEQRRARDRATSAVYAYTDGRCSNRAAVALMNWAEDAQPRSRPKVKNSPKG